MHKGIAHAKIHIHAHKQITHIILQHQQHIGRIAVQACASDIQDKGTQIKITIGEIWLL